ncbi:MAG: DUF222 domain-containing protein [Gammaproteobacteria bacterium]|nr:DUF222 domain-containing protein [Gammaproteobacteria bacterium]
MDQRAPVGDYGARSTANWLNFKCGIALGAAREKVRVARALEQLPQIDETLRRGEVSYSKVRAMTRVATPDNEALLLQYALHATASQLERIVAGVRRLERLEDPERLLNLRRSRGLRWYWDEDGMLIIHGRLAPEDGALLLKAVNAMKDRIYREEREAREERGEPEASGPPQPDPVEAGPLEGVMESLVEGPAGSVSGGAGPRSVDALLRLVETGMQAEPKPLTGGERTQVVLHVPVDAPVQRPVDADHPTEHPPTEHPVLDEGPVVAAETARRLACDAGWVVHREDASGETLSIGRRSRTVPTGMRRALQRRDRGCRFPGCGERRWVDAHHIHHWADGGETSLENLLLLCRHHHRLVHEEGFSCERAADGRIRFRLPDGGLLPEAFRLKLGHYLDLVDLNRRSGLNVSAETCNGGWDGQPWDCCETVGHVWAATTGSIASAVLQPEGGLDLEPRAGLAARLRGDVRWPTIRQGNGRALIGIRSTKQQVSAAPPDAMLGPRRARVARVVDAGD